MFRLDGGCGTDSSTSRRPFLSRSSAGTRRESPAPAGEPVERFSLGGCAFLIALLTGRDFVRAVFFAFLPVFAFGAVDRLSFFAAFLARFAIGTPPLTSWP